LEEQYLAVATVVVNRFLQVGFWQVGRRVAFLLGVALIICACSNQDCGKWVICHERVAAQVVAEWADSFAYEYVATVLAGASFHRGFSIR
jgi:hypothetical protein